MNVDNECKFMMLIKDTYFGSFAPHWTIFNFMNSSTMGAATQLTAKSATNNVILLGLYPSDRSTQGRTGSGIFGVSSKIAGSQKAKTTSRRNVAKTISNMNISMKPTVKEL